MAVPVEEGLGAVKHTITFSRNGATGLSHTSHTCSETGILVINKQTVVPVETGLDVVKCYQTWPLCTLQRDSSTSRSMFGCSQTWPLKR